MAMYHYVEIIGEFLLFPILSYNIYDNEKCYPGEPVNIYIQSVITVIQENDREITTKIG